MAVAQTDPAAAAATRRHDDDDEDRVMIYLPFSNRVKLQKLPLLTDHLSLGSDLDLVQSNLINTNPLEHNPFFSQSDCFYIAPSDVVLRHIIYDYKHPQPKAAAAGGGGGEEEKQGYSSTTTSALAYHRAGPRRQILFDASRIKAAIVTCGGLCPGLNTVVRELVLGLWDLYGVRHIFGIKAGYRGFYSTEPLPLNPKLVHNWHKNGGTHLQTSRGGFDLQKIVDAIQHRGYNQLYIIGGDGTMRGAVEIYHEICQRKLKIAVTGIPKTVDNDVGIIDRSFGFQTAVEMAQQAISAAHVEAESAVNGIGLVKLMGRSTGHIALHATLSSRDVDCCLIPETPFYLEGKGGLFEFLEQRLRENGHAVLVVAEGAGQDQMIEANNNDHHADNNKDESGNPVFLDVGQWLKSELNKWWKREHPNELFTVKYIDPTYMIRAVAANSTDNLYCTLVAHSAIHGVMAGYTGFVSGPINGNYAYIPLEEVAKAKNEVDTRDHKWAWVRSVTNQPDFHIYSNDDKA
ncbi:hypothetical protein ACFX2I_037084 [Malus domestica]|uniref:ATP-dependent 6-phosphofructokinase 2 n=1 Tax=Malus domestica TaxID=3750 RepID=UPI0010A9DA15|nr:ATP-dependent 6-phosphofructokinase 2 [Malus domestica]XP_050149456.1 ATP-dependent 6-phosphofructokinase 2 [Malus sylvestris]